MKPDTFGRAAVVSRVTGTSLVESALGNPDFLADDLIDETVLRCDPARSVAMQAKLRRLGLADALIAPTRPG